MAAGCACLLCGVLAGRCRAAQAVFARGASITKACLAALLLCRGVQLAAEAGAQDAGSRDGALPLEVLPRLPLRDLLNLYGVLATWVADTFAAGPVDLGPDFEVRFGPSASTARAS